MYPKSFMEFKFKLLDVPINSFVITPDILFATKGTTISNMPPLTNKDEPVSTIHL